MVYLLLHQQLLTLWFTEGSPQNWWFMSFLSVFPTNSDIWGYTTCSDTCKCWGHMYLLGWSNNSGALEELKNTSMQLLKVQGIGKEMLISPLNANNHDKPLLVTCFPLHPRWYSHAGLLQAAESLPQGGHGWSSRLPNLQDKSYGKSSGKGWGKSSSYDSYGSSLAVEHKWGWDRAFWSLLIHITWYFDNWLLYL